MVKQIVGALTLLMIVIGSIPFLDPGTKIVWTTYLGIPLVILAGSVGVAFISRRFEAIIFGILAAALLPFFLEEFKSALSLIFSLP